VLLTDLHLGQPIPDALSAGAVKQHAPIRSWFTVEEPWEGERAFWELSERGGRLIGVWVECCGAWEVLAAAYERLAAELTARHGPPSRADPFDDELRFAELEELGRPDERFVHLRRCEWTGPPRAHVAVCKRWPDVLSLTMAVELPLPPFAP
jgi:hypothetical protein